MSIKTILILFCCCLTIVLKGQQPSDCGVKKITIYSNILKRGGNPCYKPSGDTIAYQKSILNLSSFILSTEVYISDTSMNAAKCLTCDTTTLPVEIRHDKHKGNAEYHPNSNYILFTSENENGAHQPWNLPGAGVDNDIFIMNITGTQFWRLTNIPSGYGILHPAFSHDGTKLFWAEMYYSTLFPPQGQEYGLWDLKMADFSIVSGTPQISNVVTFAPRDSVWYESHSFSPDDEFISFTSHEKDSSAYLGDITIMDTTDIGTTNYTNLTNTPFIHDEHSHWSPDGNKISWMSGTFVGGLGTYISELYLMDANGANQMRLTHFTDSAFPEYIQDTVVTPDHYWSPDGKRIFGFVHYIDSTGWPSILYQLEFNGPCGLNPTAVIPSADVELNHLKIFPNPADEKINVSFSSHSEEINRIDIFNGVGQNILRLEVNSDETVELNVSDLPSGIYMIHVTSNKNSVQHQKLIISH